MDKYGYIYVIGNISDNDDHHVVGVCEDINYAINVNKQKYPNCNCKHAFNVRYYKTVEGVISSILKYRKIDGVGMYNWPYKTLIELIEFGIKKFNVTYEQSTNKIVDVHSLCNTLVKLSQKKNMEIEWHIHNYGYVYVIKKTVEENDHYAVGVCQDIEYVKNITEEKYPECECFKTFTVIDHKLSKRLISVILKCRKLISDEMGDEMGDEMYNWPYETLIELIRYAIKRIYDLYKKSFKNIINLNILEMEFKKVSQEKNKEVNWSMGVLV